MTNPTDGALPARLPWFALDAINAWWEHHFDGDGWFQMELDHNVGTPFVDMSLDFCSPVTPRHSGCGRLLSLFCVFNAK